MKDIVLNETSIRTSNNFQINNITLKDFSFPKIGKFENVSVKCDSQKDEISTNVSNEALTYGIGKEFQEEVFEKANFKAKIDVNTKTNKSIEFTFTFDEKNKVLVDNIDIESDENCKEVITIIYKSENDKKYYHNGIIRLHAKKGTSIKVNVINLLNEKSDNFLAIENIVEEDATVDYTVVDFGGKNSISNYYSNVVGDRGVSNIDTIFLGVKDQVIDTNYVTDLRGKKSETNMIVQGALNDNAKNHFKGIIDFKCGCKKAKGNEQESCAILSDNAKSIAMPVLLCSEEDVEGSHGNSAGKVGNKELFYIMSRGFDKKEALKLLVKAKFNSIIEKFSSDEYKNRIRYEIDKRLD